MTHAAPPHSRVAITCGQPGCPLPAGYITIAAGHLVVEIVSRHHGVKHRTYVTVDHAGRLVTGDSAHVP